MNQRQIKFRVWDIGNRRMCYENQNFNKNSFLSAVCCVVFFASTTLFAQPLVNLGVHGTTFPIVEQNALEFVQERLAAILEDGTLEAFEQQAKERVKYNARNPVGKKYPRATENKQFEKDISFFVKNDLKDSESKVIVKGNTNYNPLTNFSYEDIFLFFDAEDNQQLRFVLDEIENNHNIFPVLTNGKPIDLTEEYDKDFYFDQRHRLIDFFGIEALPARVFQSGDKLIVEEIAI